MKENLLIDDEYLHELISVINAAKQTIDLQVYIFADDTVGKMMANAMCNAAKRGVIVRLLIDGVGSMSFGGELASQLKAAKVAVNVYHPVPWNISHWYQSTSTWKHFIAKFIGLFFKLNSRNHSKVCIVDQQIVLLGSANITSHLIDENNETKWRETGVKLQGVDISGIQYMFNRLFARRHFHLPFRKLKADPVFQLNYSWRLRRRAIKSLMRDIDQAKEKIWIANAYFIPNIALLNKLIAASKRGVDVRIILSAKSDVLIASLAATTFYARLLKNGAVIYEYLRGVMHQKVMIIDDIYFVGSSNLDDRSFHHNIEVNVKLQMDATKHDLYQQFQQDFNQARVIQQEDVKNQSIVKRFIANCVLRARYYL